jgi:hypothetical protein
MLDDVLIISVDECSVKSTLSKWREWQDCSKEDRTNKRKKAIKPAK